MSQIATRTVTFRSIVNKRAFRDGWEEARAGKPLDPNKCEDSWDYERGRLFGLVYSGPLKIGKRVSFNAVHAFARAFADGTII